MPTALDFVPEALAGELYSCIEQVTSDETEREAELGNKNKPPEKAPDKCQLVLT